MRSAKRLGVGLLVLVALALVLPYLIPLNLYIPALQSLASEKLKEPVVIGDLGFALLPLPAVTVRDIAVGREQEVRLGAITVRPDLFSLLGEVKVIRAVEIEGVTVDRAFLDRLPVWSKPEPGPKTVIVKRVEVRQLNLVLDKFKWGPLRADVELDKVGISSVEAGTEDRRLTATLTPRTEGYHVAIVGKHWSLPVTPALEFDELVGEGALTDNSLDLPKIDGKLYGGDLHATSRVEWKDGIRIKGEARSAGVEIGPIVKLMSQSTSLSGKLHAKGSYALGAKKPAQLADSLRAGFKFEVRQGVLYNFDLANAVRSLATQGTRGGQTSFSELSGTVNLVGKNAHLRDVKVASGVLQANGNVDIAASKKLAGTVNVEMKGTASLIKVPLEVSGTLQDPLLLPNRAALAGAAVGTGLLGPGFGTGVGAKAGEALNNLFK